MSAAAKGTPEVYQALLNLGMSVAKLKQKKSFAPHKPCFKTQRGSGEPDQALSFRRRGQLRPRLRRLLRKRKVAGVEGGGGGGGGEAEESAGGEGGPSARRMQAIVQESRYVRTVDRGFSDPMSNYVLKRHAANCFRFQ